jgi:hypothetical protein
MDAMIRKIDDVAPAWRELGTRTPVKLTAIRSERHRTAMTEFILMDQRELRRVDLADPFGSSPPGMHTT